MDKQDSEFWGKFCKVFNLDVHVSIPKKVTGDDIILTLCQEGDFIFKGKSGHTKMNLKHMEGKATKKELKVFRDILWQQVSDYVTKKPEKDTILAKGETK